VQARAVVGKSQDCFQHPAMFYQHHAGEPYVSRFMRIKKESAA
jgi:hypothetical protein